MSDCYPGCLECEAEAAEIEAAGVAIVGPPVTIRVTFDLMAKGTPRDCRRCAVALAIAEHVRSDVAVFVRRRSAYFGLQSDLAGWTDAPPAHLAERVRLPYEAAWFIDQYDAEWPADELMFPLEIPERFLK